jgi:L-histidine Nalpha-methyltransferase
MRNPVQVAREARVLPPPSARPLIAMVFEGLSEQQKQLPCVLFYDAEGSRLFEQICAQPEYYLSRSETRLLEQHGSDIARCIGPRAALVDYGAGSGRKTQLLLAALREPHSYVPIDVDPVQLDATCFALRRRFPRLAMHPLTQDFRHYFALPAVARAKRRVAFFAGSTIGNFRPLEAVALLSSIRETMGPGGGLLIGVDLVKDAAVLERAYDDAAGVTAAFNMNVLARLNRELEATFDLAAFQHRAAWDEANQRIEMSLVSTRAQVPSVAGIGVALAAGEAIVTEHCHKYTLDSFSALARTSGWDVRQTWVDPEHGYSLQYLETSE